MQQGYFVVGDNDVEPATTHSLLATDAQTITNTPSADLY